MQQAMKDKSPYGLNEWLHYLKAKKFPVKAVNLARLKVQLESSESTLDGIQKNIISDPMLAFAILNQANNIAPNKNSGIKTPFHAAAMVGTNGIKKLFSQFSSYEIKPKSSPNLIAFLSEVQTSYEAATIAKYWAIEKTTGHEEDIFWITLFRHSIRWLLWFYAYPIMSAIDKRMKEGEKAHQVELDILGCRIDELTIHLCKYWNTSNEIIDSFLTKHVPNSQELQDLAHLANHPDELPGFTEDKRLTILVNSPLIFSYCATKVAREASLMGWDSNNLPFFYRVVASVMHRRLGEVIQTAHLASTEAATLYNTKGKIPLAQQLLNPELFTKKNPIGNTRSLSPLASLKMKMSDKSNLDFKQKTNLALKAIKKTIPNMQRCLIFQQSNNKIRPVYQSGYSPEKIKSIQWNRPSNVFKKLSSKQSATHTFGQKLSNLLKELPHTSNTIIHNDSHLILASVFSSKNEMIIFWLETRSKFDEKEYKTLKKIVSLISHTTE